MPGFGNHLSQIVLDWLTLYKDFKSYCDLSKAWQPGKIFYFEYIEDIQIFGMNIPFFHQMKQKAKNAYFMSGEATNEIYIFSLHPMK